MHTESETGVQEEDQGHFNTDPLDSGRAEGALSRVVRWAGAASMQRRLTTRRPFTVALSQGRGRASLPTAVDHGLLPDFSLQLQCFPWGMS